MKEVQLNEQLKNLLQRNKDPQAKELNEIILGKTEEKRIHLQLPQRNILAFGTTLMMVFLILAAYQRSSYQQTRKLSEQKTGQHKQNNEHQNGFLYSVVDHPPQAQHKHPIAPLKYASLGIPHVGELFNYSKVCLSSFNEYEKHLYDYFRPYNDTDCQYEIYGSSGNQSYVLCKNFIRNSHALLNIGQDGKDSFGCSISSQFNIPNHLYQCKKHSYVQQYCQGNNKLTKFQRKCFGDAVQKIEDYEFTMLNRQIDLKGLEDKNIIVKMNVGGNQWVALRNNPLEYFQKVDQLILTVYLPHQSLRNTVYWGNIDIINSLRENFVSVYVHLNNLFRIKIVEMKEMQRRYSCAVFYVTLVNKRVIKLKSEDRSYNQKIKSYKNNPNDDYLQITEQ